MPAPTPSRWNTDFAFVIMYLVYRCRIYDGVRFSYIVYSQGRFGVVRGRFAIWRCIVFVKITNLECFFFRYFVASEILQITTTIYLKKFFEWNKNLS